MLSSSALVATTSEVALHRICHGRARGLEHAFTSGVCDWVMSTRTRPM